MEAGVVLGHPNSGPQSCESLILCKLGNVQVRSGKEPAAQALFQDISPMEIMNKHRRGISHPRTRLYPLLPRWRYQAVGSSFTV